MKLRKHTSLLSLSLVALAVMFMASFTSSEQTAEAYWGNSAHAPSLNAITEHTHNSVKLEWSPPRSGDWDEPDGYKILRRDVISDKPGIFNTVGAIYTDRTYYADTLSVKSGRKYAYRIQAWIEDPRTDREKANGDTYVPRSPWSNYQNVKTHQPPEPDEPEPEPVDPNSQACTAGNDSQWVNSTNSFSRSGYTYYGCNVKKHFDTSRGPQKFPRYRVLVCDHSCKWENG